MIAQWLRRLAWDLSLERAGDLCGAIRDRITAEQPTEGVSGVSDHEALTLASQILRQVNRQGHGS